MVRGLALREVYVRAHVNRLSLSLEPPLKDCVWAHPRF